MSVGYSGAACLGQARLLGRDEWPPLGSRVMGVRLPGGFVFPDRLVAPHRPARARTAGEQLQVRAIAARLNEAVQLVGFAAVFALTGGEIIHLPPPGRQRTRVLAADAEKHQLSHVPEIEPDASTIGAAVLSHLVPHKIGLVLEPPGGKDP